MICYRDHHPVLWAGKHFHVNDMIWSSQRKDLYSSHFTEEQTDLRSPLLSGHAGTMMYSLWSHREYSSCGDYPCALIQLTNQKWWDSAWQLLCVLLSLSVIFWQSQYCTSSDFLFQCLCVLLLFDFLPHLKCICIGMYMYTRMHISFLQVTGHIRWLS